MAKKTLTRKSASTKSVGGGGLTTWGNLENTIKYKEKPVIQSSYYRGKDGLV